MNYNWPGSVRELQNVVERMVGIATDGRIGLQHVPEKILCDSPDDVQPATFANIEDERRRMRWMLERREQEQLSTFVQKHGSNISRVARERGVSRNTVYRRIRKASTREGNG